jgi:IclR family transcriptional regulator, acetate operon repressor
MNNGQELLWRSTSESSETPSDQPLDRALAVLSAVADAAHAISMTEIAAECGLPVPTVHRIVAQLERRGLLNRALGSKKLVVGRELVRLGMASLEGALRTDRPHHILATLANRLGEHCQIGRRFDDAIVYIDSATVQRTDGLYFEQGGRAPMHCTSTGKLFLAEMSDADLDFWIAHADLKRMAPATIVSAHALRTVVRKVRQEAWATTIGELVVGVVGCAVPIRTASGRLIAGLGVSAPVARTSPEQLRKYRPLMQSAAAEIAAAISEDE